MATRQEVYEAVDTEREYQDRLPQGRTDGREHTVGEFLTMLQYYMTEAQKAWTTNAGDAAALHVVRKIAGISVNCMEKWGAPKRDLNVLH